MAKKEEPKKVDLVCAACGRKGCIEVHSPMAEALHARMPQYRAAEILCAECSALRRKQDLWSVTLGKEAK